MNENPSPETLAGDSHVASSDGGGTVESPSLTLAELNQFLGADFKDPTTALKALKDTKDFVGKRREDIASEVRSQLEAGSKQNDSQVGQLQSEVPSIKNALFYSQNPQYKGYEAMINKLGTNPADVVNSEEFKTVFEKVQKADEVEQTKSVVSSNTRLSQPTSTVEEMVKVANARGTTMEDVALVAARDINQIGREQ